MLVFLTGYRGSGKTTVGRLLADQLRWAFVDLDEHVTTTAGKTVREIFDAEGEAGFRDRESAALRVLTSCNQTVIALGGGALLREENRTVLPRERSAIIYLRADEGELHRRIHSDPATAATRPALTSLGGGIDEIRQLLAAREPIYRQVMTHEVDVTNRDPADIARQLHRTPQPASYR